MRGATVDIDVHAGQPARFTFYTAANVIVQGDYILITADPFYPYVFILTFFA